VTTYYRVVRIELDPENKNAPHKQYDLYINGTGIDASVLKWRKGLQTIDVQFTCSDENPSCRRTMEDIDHILSQVRGVKETLPDSQSLKTCQSHMIKIETILDNPNLERQGMDYLRSKAKDVHDIEMSQEEVNDINDSWERDNKKLSETSTDNSDIKKPLQGTKFKFGEVARE